MGPPGCYCANPGHSGNWAVPLVASGRSAVRACRKRRGSDALRGQFSHLLSPGTDFSGRLVFIIADISLVFQMSTLRG